MYTNVRIWIMSNGIEIIKIFETKIWIVFVDIDYFVFCIIFLSFIWKIWSVSEFLNTPKEEVPQSKSGSSNSIMNAMNRSLANAGSYFYLQTNNHSLPHGRYSAFGAYPHLSLSHTTLSYLCLFVNLPYLDLFPHFM
jgi:hypothetical protein